MPGYRAGAGGGLFGSNVYPDSRPRVDVGAALDSLGHTAESLIGQAYQRKVGQQELAIRQSQADLERQRFASESDFRNRQLTFQQTQADREHTLNTARSDRETAAAIAGLLPQGYSFDDAPTRTEAAYGAPAAVATPAASVNAPSAPVVPPPVSSELDGSPEYRSSIDAAYSVGPAGTAAAAPSTSSAVAPSASASPSPSTAPGITIGGRRLVYKGYGASSQGQAEAQREAFEKEFEGLKSKDEQTRAESLARLNSTLELNSKLKFLPAETAAKIQVEVEGAKAKAASMLPKTEEMRIAGLMPELVSTVKNIDAYDAPELLTKLGSRGVMGNYAVNAEGQQFNQSAAQFLQALAFARSGKRINDAEIERMRDAYIPKPGDTEQVVAKKRTARQQAINGVLTGSGRGMNFVPAEDLEYLRGKGYAPSASSATPPAAAAAPPANAPGTPAPTDTGNVNLNAPRRVGAKQNAGQLTQQRADYDKAAEHLKASGKDLFAIVAELGPRP